MGKELIASDIQTLEWWTPKECANRWRVSTDTVIRMIDRGELKGLKFGGRWRIHNSVVERYEQGAKTRSSPPARPDVVLTHGDPLGIYSDRPSTGRSR
jgi:excisionase family DNA binding protein